jgi:hypothetical protein
MLDAFLRACGRVLDAHRKTSPGTGDTWRIQPLRDALAVQRGRHHQQAQVGTQRGLHVQRQHRAEIAGQVALVEFVEHDGTDAAQFRIVLDEPRQDAFGDHLDPGRRAYLRFEADAVADGLADRFAQLLRHELRGGARGDSARFQHHDLPPPQPRRVKQGQRHLSGLAGAWRRLQYQPRMRGERGANLRQQRRDGEYRRGCSHPRR